MGIDGVGGEVPGVRASLPPTERVSASRNHERAEVGTFLEPDDSTAAGGRLFGHVFCTCQVLLPECKFQRIQELWSDYGGLDPHKYFFHLRAGDVCCDCGLAGKWRIKLSGESHLCAEAVCYAVVMQSRN